jgi:hypothetical protein
MNPMNEPDRGGDALDALLRATAPQPVADNGFVARTMAAVDRAALGLPAARRPAPVAPLAIARALAAEQRRHDVQTRVWRWAIAGVIAGFLLLAVAVATAPDGIAFDLAGLPHWYPLWTTLSAAALWYAWQEFRAA